MTAKTILVQLHHKIQTFEHLSKKLVLVVQDHLLAYMKKKFSFDHLENARLGDPMHFHSYSLEPEEGVLKLQLAEQLSTDTAGIAKCLGLQSEAKVEVKAIIRQIEDKLSDHTLMNIETPPPAESLLEQAAEAGQGRPALAGGFEVQSGRGFQPQVARRVVVSRPTWRRHRRALLRGSWSVVPAPGSAPAR